MESWDERFDKEFGVYQYETLDMPPRQKEDFGVSPKIEDIKAFITSLLAEKEAEIARLKSALANKTPEKFYTYEIVLLNKRVLTLTEALKKMEGLIKMALDELGVPQPDYPAPVSNVVDFLREALRSQGEGESHA